MVCVANEVNLMKRKGALDRVGKPGGKLSE